MPRLSVCLSDKPEICWSTSMSCDFQVCIINSQRKSCETIRGRQFGLPQTDGCTKKKSFYRLHCQIIPEWMLHAHRNTVTELSSDKHFTLCLDAQCFSLIKLRCWKQTLIFRQKNLMQRSRPWLLYNNCSKADTFNRKPFLYFTFSRQIRISTASLSAIITPKPTTQKKDGHLYYTSYTDTPRP
jgi:hypothetical protein